MKIIQILTTLNYGDAVGNDVLALNDLIKNMGYKTQIYAENVHPKLKHSTKYINNIPKLKKDDIILYHLSIGTALNFELPKYPCKKILIYHNITPPDFFKPYNLDAYKNCLNGLKGAKFLSDKVDYCLAVSEFNKQDLLNMNYKMPIDILPILIPFEDYKQIPDINILKKYTGDFVNILFTGRIAPNKKIEDIIATFYYYKKYINENSRLILVGSYDEKDGYYQKLKTFIDKLELSDVIFSGHISFKEILAYFHVADIFLCMSEHEGFCVPLIEAMFFNIPIIAYNSCAVPETLGNSGFIIYKKNYIEIAELIQKILTDLSLKQKIIENQNNRLKYFDKDRISNIFKGYITNFINNKDL